jgi:hypothetical protein
MATIQAIAGMEWGTANGLVTGNTGSRIFDSATGTLGTDIQVIAGAAKNGSYGLRISGANNFVRWDTNTLGASRTSVVFHFWWRASTDPSGLKEIFVFDLTGAGNDFASLDYIPASNLLRWFGPGGSIDSSTINPNVWYLVEGRYTISSGTHTFVWQIDGVAQTGLSGSQTADTFAGVCFGDRSSGTTGASDFDDILISITSGDYPLGEHRVDVVSVDPSGTVTLSGTTGNFQTFSGSTPTKTAWNATTARDAVDELPPNTGSSQDGWCQITTAANDYVEMPMTSLTLGSDVVVAARMYAAIWSQDATGGFFGLRSYNGTTETNLFGATISISGNNTTTLPWVSEMLTLADVNTQAELDDLRIRGGFSTDAAPDMGLHAVYVELALLPGTGDATSAIDITLGVAATGARDSAATAPVAITLGVAATGSRTSAATAAVAITLGVAAVGQAPPPQGQAAIDITLGVAATGSATPVATAAVALTLEVAAEGGTTPAGMAAVAVDVSIQAIGRALVIPIRVLTEREILTGNRNTKFYLDILDPNDSPVARLDGVTAGKLDWLSNAVVKGGGELTVVDVNQSINWLTARIRPVMQIQGLPPQPLGIFLPSETPESWDNGRKWSLKLLDKTTILDQDTIAETYGLAAGSVVTDEIIALIESAGITNHAITASAEVLDGDLVWSVGTNKIHIINDLLSLINYFSLFANFEGQMVGEPYTVPANRPLVYEFLDDNESIYSPNFNRDNDVWKIPNRVTLIGVGDAGTAALTSTVENTDPDSPYSIANRGRVIGVTENGVEAVDQAALDALARKRLIELTSPTAGVEIAHAPLPGLAVNQAVRFRRTVAGIDARHAVFRTAITLDGKALATSTLREVVDL